MEKLFYINIISIKNLEKFDELIKNKVGMQNLTIKQVLLKHMRHHDTPHIDRCLIEFNSDEDRYIIRYIYENYPYTELLKKISDEDLLLFEDPEEFRHI